MYRWYHAVNTQSKFEALLQDLRSCDTTSSDDDNNNNTSKIETKENEKVKEVTEGGKIARAEPATARKLPLAVELDVRWGSTTMEQQQQQGQEQLTAGNSIDDRKNSSFCEPVLQHSAGDKVDLTLHEFLSVLLEKSNRTAPAPAGEERGDALSSSEAPKATTDSTNTCKLSGSDRCCCDFSQRQQQQQQHDINTCCSRDRQDESSSCSCCPPPKNITLMTNIAVLKLDVKEEEAVIPAMEMVAAMMMAKIGRDNVTQGDQCCCCLRMKEEGKPSHCSCCEVGCATDVWFNADILPGPCEAKQTVPTVSSSSSTAVGMPSSSPFCSSFPNLFPFYFSCREGEEKESSRIDSSVTTTTTDAVVASQLQITQENLYSIVKKYHAGLSLGWVTSGGHQIPYTAFHIVQMGKVFGMDIGLPKEGTSTLGKHREKIHEEERVKGGDKKEKPQLSFVREAPCITFPVRYCKVRHASEDSWVCMSQLLEGIRACRCSGTAAPLSQGQEKKNELENKNVFCTFWRGRDDGEMTQEDMDWIEMKFPGSCVDSD